MHQILLLLHRIPTPSALFFFFSHSHRISFGAPHKVVLIPSIEQKQGRLDKNLQFWVQKYKIIWWLRDKSKKIKMKQCSYVYNDQITKYVFSEDHPMKPKRIKMAHSLVEDFNLESHMRIFRGRSANRDEICEFHHPNYIEYLQNWVSPQPQNIVKQFYPIKPKQSESEAFNEMYKINRTFDCPSFDGLYNFCELAVGGSLDAADLIITGESHHAINWSGGYHHAKKSQASGFCYVNDIVVCILELLKVYPRVMYVDIDVHHGDGVEEAFYHTNRVMTVSFHQFEDDFFPGTGEVESVGEGMGRFFSVNVPLRKGITDVMYVNLFKKVMDMLLKSYHPDVIVLQSGADSLSKDRIGNFELTVEAYGECVEYMKRFNVPMVLLGGGGYTIENVARCWTYETAVMLNQNIGNVIPENNEFSSYYQEDGYKLHFPIKGSENLNQQKDIDRLIEIISENIRESEIRPSMAFHYAPKHFLPTNDLDWKTTNGNEDSMEDEGLHRSFK